MHRYLPLWWISTMTFEVWWLYSSTSSLSNPSLRTSSDLSGSVLHQTNHRNHTQPSNELISQRFEKHLKLLSSSNSRRLRIDKPIQEKKKMHLSIDRLRNGTIQITFSNRVEALCLYFEETSWLELIFALNHPQILLAHGISCFAMSSIDLRVVDRSRRANLIGLLSPRNV